MCDELNMQILISKGIIYNYETEVIKNETNEKLKKEMIDTIEEFKNSLASVEFYNGSDTKIIQNHCSDLKTFIELLREIGMAPFVLSKKKKASKICNVKI